MKRSIMLALVCATTTCATAHAGLNSWTTCYHGKYGKTEVQGRMLCRDALPLFATFVKHIPPDMHAGDVTEFHQAAGGLLWDCFITVRKSSSRWDCFGGRHTRWFRFLDPMGATS